MAKKGDEPLVKRWEAAVLGLPVVLTIVAALLQYYRFSYFIVTPVFVMIPFSMGVAIIILDFVRSRLSQRGWRWR